MWFQQMLALEKQHRGLGCFGLSVTGDKTNRRIYINLCTVLHVLFFKLFTALFPAIDVSYTRCNIGSLPAPIAEDADAIHTGHCGGELIDQNMRKFH